MGVGAALGGLTGLSSGISSLIGEALGPQVPKANQILDSAMTAYTGVSPTATLKMQTLQSKLAQAQADVKNGKIADPGRVKSLQNEITNLQTATSDQAASGYEGQFLSNLQNILPQLQAISNAQNTGAASGALGLQNQFGTAAGQSILNSQQQLAPQFYSGQSQLGNELFSSPLGLTPQQSAYYNQQFMGNEAAMGLGSSPLGAQNAAFQLTGLNLAQSNTQLGQQQSYLGNYLQPSVPNLFGTFSPTTAQGLGGNTLGSIDPSSILNLQSNLSGLNYAKATQNANTAGGLLSGYDILSGMSGSGVNLQAVNSFFGGGSSGGGSAADFSSMFG